MGRNIIALACACTFFCGCTAFRLGKNTADQAQTVSDMHTQQVLDNLAMFACNPGAFPSFSTFKQGTSQLTDQGQIASPITWGRIPTTTIFGLTTFQLSPTLQRAAQQSWIIEPVNDARKLELMRCAYRKAVANCRVTSVCSCPDCEKRFKSFYTGTTDGDMAKVAASGIISTECLESGRCWFHMGREKCAPKHCRYVGRYCGMCVWVDADGVEELSKLTTVILDFATHDPKVPVQHLKTVMWRVDASGNPTDTRDYAGSITATIDAKDDIMDIIDAPLDGVKSEVASILKKNDLDLGGFKGNATKLLFPNLFVPAPETPLEVSERARLIRLLAKLNQLPAVNLLGFIQSRPLSLEAVVDLAPKDPKLGLSDEDGDELKKLEIAFTGTVTKSGPGPIKFNLPGAGPMGINGLDLTPSRSLTPIYVEPQKPSQPPTLLELQQELNTVTPPALLPAPQSP